MQLGSLIGGVGGLFGDKGKTETTRNVKNPGIQKEIDALLGDYGTVKSSGDQALSEYITNYLAGYPAAKTRTGQEIGNMDRYYNGQAENDLAQLRSNRTKALMAATDRASKYAIASQNRSRIGGQGGGSSYDTRQLMRSMDDIATQAAMDEAAQARGDWGYMEGQRFGLTGKRQGLADALAGYGLVPEGVRRQMYKENMGYLGGVTNLDQANNFYGLEYKPSKSEQIGGVVDDLASVALSAYTMGGSDLAGSAMGSFGGSQGGSPSYGPWGSSGYQATPPAANYMNWNGYNDMSGSFPATGDFRDYLGYGSPTQGSAYGNFFN